MQICVTHPQCVSLRNILLKSGTFPPGHPVYQLTQWFGSMSSEPQDFVIFIVYGVPASICGIVFVWTHCAWCSHTVPKNKVDKPFLLFVFSKPPCRSHSTLKLYCHHHLVIEQVCSRSNTSNLCLENDRFESQLGLCQQVFFLSLCRLVLGSIVQVHHDHFLWPHSFCCVIHCHLIIQHCIVSVLQS